jgi:uncharacterized repeat protein (TIGR04138 family)
MQPGTRDAPSIAPFHRSAQDLVVEVLEATEPGTHISGSALARAVCMVARLRFGLSARMVLEHWGLRTTSDIGRLVFHLVDEGIIRASPDDSIDDFSGIFDMAEVLEQDYPWGGG